MKVKIAAEKREDIDAALHPFVVEEEGAFFLDPTKIPDSKQLEGALAKARRDAKEAADALKPYEGLDPVAARQLMTEKEAIEREKLLQGKSLDEKLAIMTDSMRTAHQRELQQRDQSIQQLTQQLTGVKSDFKGYKVKSALRAAAVRAKIPPEYHDDVEFRASQFDEAEDGNIYLVEGAGDTRTFKRSAKDATLGVTPDEWLEIDMPKQKPGWFPQSSGGGSGGGRGAKPVTGAIDRSDTAAVSANLEGIASGKTQVS
jgi:hypothetical protein